MACYCLRFDTQKIFVYPVFILHIALGRQKLVHSRRQSYRESDLQRCTQDMVKYIPMMEFYAKLVNGTAQNTVISPNFLVWKFFRNAHFPQSFGRFARNSGGHNFHTRKLGGITVFYAVTLNKISQRKLVNSLCKKLYYRYLTPLLNTPLQLQYLFCRICSPKVFCEKAVLKYGSKFTRNHLRRSLFF